MVATSSLVDGKGAQSALARVRSQLHVSLLGLLGGSRNVESQARDEDDRCA